jgi:hypothetical protein
MRRRTSIIGFISAVAIIAIMSISVQLTLYYEVITENNRVTAFYAWIGLAVLAIGAVFLFSILISFMFILLKMISGPKRALKMLEGSPLRAILWEEIQGGK